MRDALVRRTDREVRVVARRVRVEEHALLLHPPERGRDEAVGSDLTCMRVIVRRRKISGRVRRCYHDRVIYQKGRLVNYQFRRLNSKKTYHCQTGEHRGRNAAVTMGKPFVQLPGVAPWHGSSYVSSACWAVSGSLPGRREAALPTWCAE